MIRFKVTGDFKNFERWSKRATDPNRIINILNRYGTRGVDVLSLATPVDTSKTAHAWSYNVEKTNRGYTLSWSNDNEKNGVPIVILLVYGHGTRGGTYVSGNNFINPAMSPLFDKLANELWEEVRRL